MKISAAVLCLLLFGCASWDFSSARTIKIRPGKGGVLTLNPPNDPKARAKAQTIMNQTCQGKKSEITEEGEEVVGTKSVSNAEHNAGSAGQMKGKWTVNARPASETVTSEQQNMTEWRITFECK